MLDQNEIARLLDSIRTRQADLFRRFDLAEIERQLDTVPSDRQYHDLPAFWTSALEAVSREFGESGRDALRRGTLLWLMLRFPERAKGKGYAEGVLNRFDISMTRICELCKSGRPKEYEGESDLYLKDLAICRQRLFPAGAAQVVEPDSGFPRSLMFRKGMRQAFGVTHLLLLHGGNRPYYQTHIHMLEIDDYNPDSWYACYLRIADMLALHPEIRGTWGGSWFYDPALAAISPQISYHRERQVENGAFLFFSEVSINTGALSKSERRKKLYEEGKYLPKLYAMIWPREPLLRWAERYRRAACGDVAT